MRTVSFRMIEDPEYSSWSGKRYFYVDLNSLQGDANACAYLKARRQTMGKHVYVLADNCDDGRRFPWNMRVTVEAIPNGTRFDFRYVNAFPETMDTQSSALQ